MQEIPEEKDGPSKGLLSGFTYCFAFLTVSLSVASFFLFFFSLSLTVGIFLVVLLPDGLVGLLSKRNGGYCFDMILVEVDAADDHVVDQCDIALYVFDIDDVLIADTAAVTDRFFHWQSQSQTSDSSPVGRRYIEHQAQGFTPILFIRDRKRLSNGLTSPYIFAGPLRYHKHEGSKPITFIWELEHALPAKALSWARRVG